MKHYALTLILPFFLLSCSKSDFFGEKGGADAYRVGALEPLKPLSDLDGQNLPSPKTQKPYAAAPSKVIKASELLGIDNKVQEDSLIADHILKGKKDNTALDFDAFDTEMQATYKAEEKARGNTLMDSFLGRDKAPIDPLLNTKEDDDSLFSF